MTGALVFSQKKYNMYFISHRGNVNGKNSDLENSPFYITSALNKGFHVEVDVYYKDGFYLGHDYPSYSINKSFLEHPHLWCHAKNELALEHMLLSSNIHCFWHENDKYTITSKGYIWAYPGSVPLNKSIILNFDNTFSISDLAISSGVCSDNIADIYELFKNL